MRNESREEMSHTLNYLRPKDHHELLNPVKDEESSTSFLSLLEDLPRIVVCGNPCSDKASVLEAISGLKFPVKSINFTVELTLHKSPKPSTEFYFKTQPEHGEAEIRRLLHYNREVQGRLDLLNIIEEAESFLGIGNPNVISTETLCIIATGPEYPHLTLVSLPGLFGISINPKSNMANREVSRRLIRSHVSRPRTVILVPMSVHDRWNQYAAEEICRELGSEKTWTMFVLTEPDTMLTPSIREEIHCIRVTYRESVFGVAWHLLRNGTSSERRSTIEWRSTTGRSFFFRGRCPDPNLDYLGANGLRFRINGMLKDQTVLALRADELALKRELSECRKTVDRFGSCSTSIEEVHLNLSTGRLKLDDLLRDALLGNYIDPFFVDGPEIDNNRRRLRTVFQGISDAFIEKMRREGRAREITIDGEALDDHNNPEEAMIDYVQKMMKKHRCRELPGTFNSQTLQALFEAQIGPWNAIIEQFEDEVTNAARETVVQAIDYVISQHITDYIMKYVDGWTEELKMYLHSKIAEIQGKVVQAHLVMHNERYSRDMQKARSAAHERSLRESLAPFFQKKDDNEHILWDIDTVIQTICETIEGPDMDRYASIQAIYAMESYYNIALEHVISNIQLLIVGWPFMQKLASIFHSDLIHILGEEAIQAIIMENKHASAKVGEAKAKISRIEKQLEDIRSYQDFSIAHKELELSDHI